MKQPIELRRLRDFGQVINDSFTFLKENFKPLFKALLIICGFFILISTISSVFAYLNMGGAFNFNVNANDLGSRPAGYFISLMVNIFILIITQSFIHLVTLCYISVYLQKQNLTPTLSEVWDYFKFYFFRVVGSGILIFLILMIGTMLCFIPGIYLMPIMYLVIPIIIIENSSFRYAFNKSFVLIKDNWWLVFGVIFIMSLIISVASSIASIPISILTVGSKFFTAKSYTLPLIIIFSALKNILLLAYSLPAIAISLCYFNLSEQKDGTGLLDRIERLGKSVPNTQNLPTEEY